MMAILHSRSYGMLWKLSRASGNKIHFCEMFCVQVARGPGLSKKYSLVINEANHGDPASTSLRNVKLTLELNLNVVKD